MIEHIVLAYGCWHSIAQRRRNSRRWLRGTHVWWRISMLFCCRQRSLMAVSHWERLSNSSLGTRLPTVDNFFRRCRIFLYGCDYGSNAVFSVLSKAEHMADALEDASFFGPSFVLTVGQRRL